MKKESRISKRLSDSLKVLRMRFKSDLDSEMLDRNGSIDSKRETCDELIELIPVWRSTTRLFIVYSQKGFSDVTDEKWHRSHHDI